MPSIAQNNSKRTTENSATDTRADGLRSVARRRSEEHVRQKNPARPPLISNISERDRAKDVEQLDDILRTFINVTNKFDTRFGTIRDEVKMLAFETLMFESLLIFRFFGTTEEIDLICNPLSRTICCNHGVFTSSALIFSSPARCAMLRHKIAKRRGHQPSRCPSSPQVQP